MINPIQIMRAWSKVLREVTTDEDKRRARICSCCSHKKYHKFIDFVDDELEEVKGFVCTDCHCPLLAKIRSTDTCYKWKE
jgi:TPP-dependent indolepyruvate ferredoxin oxidoreductase alpha subunit